MELLAWTEPVDGSEDYTEIRVVAADYDTGRSELEALVPEGRRMTGVLVRR